MRHQFAIVLTTTHPDVSRITQLPYNAIAVGRIDESYAAFRHHKAKDVTVQSAV